MCQYCEGRLTYASIYNEAYEAYRIHRPHGRTEIETWIWRKLSLRACLRVRARTLRHLQRAMSQTIFRKVSARTHRRIQREEQAVTKTVHHHLTRLQTEVAKHVWRPGSDLTKRAMARAIRLLEEI